MLPLLSPQAHLAMLQLEAAQGVPDSEARGKLEQLKQQTTALAAAQQRAAAMDLASAPEATDQQLARSLNRYPCPKTCRPARAAKPAL